MRIGHFVFLIVILATTINFAGDSEIIWTDFPDEQFKVSGLSFWQQNQPNLYRLPKSAKELVRKPVWNLGKSPSGGRIRFQSNCTQLSIRLLYPSLGGMRNMHKFGQSGVDLYVDGVYVNTAIPQDSTFVEHEFFAEKVKQMREFTLYLPLYNGVKVLAIGVNAKAEFEQAAPFAVDKPVVYYGSSITQGGCASHSGMSYQAIVSRHLALDFVNLGFSGNGMGEPEVAEIVASIDASCYVMDFGVNLPSADSVASVYGPFLKIIRNKRPDTPIICVTPIYNAHEYWGPNKATFMREVIRKEVAKRRAAGDNNILLVEGFELLGPNFSDGFVDGVHPNDLGFQAMAEGLQPYLARVLNVSGSGFLLKH
jgi:lysophospholipase L1-like esterase